MLVELDKIVKELNEIIWGLRKTGTEMAQLGMALQESPLQVTGKSEAHPRLKELIDFGKLAETTEKARELNKRKEGLEVKLGGITVTKTE